MASCSGQHHGLKQMPESPEALRGETRGPWLPFHVLQHFYPPGLLAGKVQGSVWPPGWKESHPQTGEAQRCSETVGRGREHERCHRWKWLQDSSYLGLGGLDQWPCLGVKRLALVPICPH